MTDKALVPNMRKVHELAAKLGNINLQAEPHKSNNKNEINILMLGETGVGKSTFINSFVNYLMFDNMREAINNAICLIPTKFTLMDSNTRSMKTITLGSHDPHENIDAITESSTQYPRCYTFNFEEFKLNIIDTPGIADTKGIENDNKNMQNILKFISHYSHINGICVLLKPNNAKVSIVFKYCILELLSHLNKSAANNIMFVFTNARGTFYMPGDTAVALSKVLQDVHKRPPNVEIKFTNDNTFCFDNESFRYLVAVSKPNNMVFNKDIEADYEKSWSISSNECLRMIEYLTQITPHNVNETLSINQAKRNIQLLTQPLADITKNIADNIKECEIRTAKILQFKGNIETLKQELYIPVIEIRSKPLPHPKTVCSDNNCCEGENIDGEVKKHYKTSCHGECYLDYDDGNVIGNKGLLDCQAFNEYKVVGPRKLYPQGTKFRPDTKLVTDSETGLLVGYPSERKQHDDCQVCGHSYQTHLHIKYETEKVKTRRMDEAKHYMITNEEMARKAQQEKVDELMELRDSYNRETRVITDCMAQFAAFLKHNALTPFNDAFEDYVNYLISVEQHNDQLVPGCGRQTVQQLQDMLKQYKHEKDIIMQSMARGDRSKFTTTTLADIDNCINKLCQLPMYGQVIRQHFFMQIELSDKFHQDSMVKEIKVDKASSFVNRTKKFLSKLIKLS